MFRPCVEYICYNVWASVSNSFLTMNWHLCRIGLSQCVGLVSNNCVIMCGPFCRITISHYVGHSVENFCQAQCEWLRGWHEYTKWWRNTKLCEEFGITMNVSIKVYVVCQSKVTKKEQQKDMDKLYIQLIFAVNQT